MLDTRMFNNQITILTVGWLLEDSVEGPQLALDLRRRRDLDGALLAASSGRADAKKRR
jgi:hypothetical protein